MSGNGGLDGTRTHDPRIKSSVLYHLSYQPLPFSVSLAVPEFTTPARRRYASIRVTEGSDADAFGGARRPPKLGRNIGRQSQPVNR